MKKSGLAPDAEESAAEVVFYVNLAARAEAADQFHTGSRRLAACTEEFGGVVLVKRVFLVILAVLAVFPADSPVLFSVLNNWFAGFKHEREGERLWDIDLFIGISEPGYGGYHDG